MGIHMHLICFDLVPHTRQQHLDLRGRPPTETRKQRQRVAIHGTAEELHAEIATNLLQSFVLGPGADGTDLLVQADVGKGSVAQEPLKLGRHVKHHTVGVGNAVEFGLAGCGCGLDCLCFFIPLKRNISLRSIY